MGAITVGTKVPTPPPDELASSRIASAPGGNRTRRAPLSFRYVLQRLLTAATAVWAVVTLVYFALLSTGNPAQLLVGPDAPPGEAERISKLMGFDRSWGEQYWVFLKQTFTGQFPDSIRYGESPLRLILERLPASVTLGLTAIVVGSLLGAAAGYLGATSRITALRRIPISVLTAFDAVPTFFFGVLLIFVFSVSLAALPAAGGGSLAHLVLPVATLAVVIAAPVARIFRASLLDTLNLEHVRTARAKGRGNAVVMLRHVVANALPPVFNVLGVQAGIVLGGAVITESLFAWPGLGQLSISALDNRDYPLVLACVTVIAVGFAVVNLAVDFVGAVLDPRSRK
jgi:peptide/nickel transport system permease protein